MPWWACELLFECGACPIMTDIGMSQVPCNVALQHHDMRGNLFQITQPHDERHVIDRHVHYVLQMSHVRYTPRWRTPRSKKRYWSKHAESANRGALALPPRTPEYNVEQRLEKMRLRNARIMKPSTLSTGGLGDVAVPV